eukprot:PhM_4_TR4824/c0_g1_i1/m.16694
MYRISPLAFLLLLLALFSTILPTIIYAHDDGGVWYERPITLLGGTSASARLDLLTRWKLDAQTFHLHIRVQQLLPAAASTVTSVSWIGFGFIESQQYDKNNNNNNNN